MNTTIRIDDFRAENDTQTFANAMAYMRTHPGTTLVVAPGHTPLPPHSRERHRPW
jgi:hypothetical protein